MTPFYKIDEVAGVNMALPCGKCPNCLKRRISNWSFRLMQEDKVSSCSLFVTLTYENPPITENGFMNLDKRDLQLFFKKLRKKTTGLKYYAAGEYGGERARPHYHIIMFNVEPYLIESTWGLGHVHIGEVNEASVGYTLKYMFKPRKIPLHQRDDRQREFSLMSKGLGKNYLSNAVRRWHIDGDRLYCVIEDGKKISLPRYYRDKIFTPEQLEAVKALLSSKQPEFTQAYIDLQFKKMGIDALKRNNNDYPKHDDL